MGAPDCAEWFVGSSADATARGERKDWGTQGQKRRRGDRLGEGRGGGYGSEVMGLREAREKEREGGSGPRSREVRESNRWGGDGGKTQLRSMA